MRLIPYFLLHVPSFGRDTKPRLQVNRLTVLARFSLDLTRRYINLADILLHNFFETIYFQPQKERMYKKPEEKMYLETVNQADFHRFDDVAPEKSCKPKNTRTTPGQMLFH